MVDRGKSLDPIVLEKKLQEFKSTKAVLFQASETSTGALMPVKAITELCLKHKVMSVCDGITAVGIFDLPMDSWGIDVLITGSQKALMLPPGLAFIALSDQAWKATEISTCPKFYLNLANEKKNQAKQQTSWTPAISLIQGGVVSLGMLRKEGLSSLFSHHEKLLL